jgi:hypothetical protein
MNRRAISTESTASSVVRCAIYTRKSTEEGLEQEFNSLDAQRESAEAYIKSQQHEGRQTRKPHFPSVYRIPNRESFGYIRGEFRSGSFPILGISETTSLTDKAEELNPRLFSFSRRNFAEAVNPVNNLRAPQTDLKIAPWRAERALGQYHRCLNQK